MTCLKYDSPALNVAYCQAHLTTLSLLFLSTKLSFLLVVLAQSAAQRSLNKHLNVVVSELGKMPAAEIDNRPVLDDAIEEDFRRKREEMQRVAKDCVLVVDNIPKIGPEKYQKLFSKLSQTFERFGRIRRLEDGNPLMSLIRNEDGYTLGFAFVEFISPEEAHKAMLSLHNLQFDRSHRFWACTAGDLERLQSVPENFVPPPAPIITKVDRPNFKSWLLDKRGRDQFMIRHEDTTSIYWHDHIVKPQLVRRFIQYICRIFIPAVKVVLDNDVSNIPC